MNPRLRGNNHTKSAFEDYRVQLRRGDGARAVAWIAVQQQSALSKSAQADCVPL